MALARAIVSRVERPFIQTRPFTPTAHSYGNERPSSLSNLHSGDRILFMEKEKIFILGLMKLRYH